MLLLQIEDLGWIASCLVTQIVCEDFFLCKSSSIPSMLTVLVVRHKITPFKRPWSTMTRSASDPSTGGRSVIRSIEQWANRQVDMAPSEDITPPHLFCADSWLSVQSPRRIARTVLGIFLQNSLLKNCF